MSNYWGYHALLDCRGCVKERIRSGENILDFVKTLVKNIDMVAYGEPVLEHFATNDEEKAGFSVVQLIETSSITGHFVDINGDAYLDVFSCKPFSIDLLKETVHAFFQPESIRVNYITRHAR